MSLVLAVEKGLVSHICGALRDLVAFVQFKKREKHPWRNVNFSKVAGLKLQALLHGCFSRFLNSTNATKSLNASQILMLQRTCKKVSIDFLNHAIPNDEH